MATLYKLVVVSIFELVVVVEFQITWHRNAEPVHAGSRFSFVHEGNFYCVDVAPVTVEDEGHWTCMAENRGGRSSCTSRLTVIGKNILEYSMKLRECPGLPELDSCWLTIVLLSKIDASRAWMTFWDSDGEIAYCTINRKRLRNFRNNHNV